jgi:hypothetical protein
VARAQPASQIHNWDDLVRTFMGNFQGTYVRPGNSWDLRSCNQKPGESLWDFIRRFSKRCTELPSVEQSEIVHAFLEGTTCRDLVRELGRSPPVDSNELFDIATSLASGEEAVGACRCLNLSTSMGGTRGKVESGDRHDLEPEGLREDTRHEIYTGSDSRSSYPTSCLG